MSVSSRPSALAGFRRAQAGSITIEFGALLPILLVVIGGICELGRYLYTEHVVTKAVLEVARIGMVYSTESEDPPSESELEAMLVDRSGLLNSDRATFDVSFVPDQQPGSTLRVQADYDFTFVPILFFDLGQRPIRVVAERTILEE